MTTVRPGDGLRAGHYKVVITPWIPGIGADQTLPAQPERPDIPKKYRQEQTSGLEVEVIAGKRNEFTFELAE